MMENDCKVKEGEKEKDVKFGRRQRRKTGVTWVKVQLTKSQAFYIHYFKLLAKMMEEGKELTSEINLAAMAYYATIPVPRRN